MLLKAPNGYNEINEQFGNPANNDGSLNQSWMHASIITVAPPKGWQLYYQASAVSLTTIKGISIHSKLKDNFQNILQEIWVKAINQVGGNPTDNAIRDYLHKQRLDVTGGGFNFRPNTSDHTKLSLHCYGIAVDWDPLHNPRQKLMKRTLPDWWYTIWQNNGWSDGRHFNTPDPMHVQFASGA